MTDAEQGSDAATVGLGRLGDSASERREARRLKLLKIWAEVTLGSLPIAIILFVAALFSRQSWLAGLGVVCLAVGMLGLAVKHVWSAARFARFGRWVGLN